MAGSPVQESEWERFVEARFVEALRQARASLKRWNEADRSEAIRLIDAALARGDGEA